MVCSGVGGHQRAASPGRRLDSHSPLCHSVIQSYESYNLYADIKLFVSWSLAPGYFCCFLIMILFLADRTLAICLIKLCFKFKSSRPAMPSETLNQSSFKTLFNRMYSTRQSSHSYKVNYGVTPSSKSIIKAQWLAGRIYFLTPLFPLSLPLCSQADIWSHSSVQCSSVFTLGPHSHSLIIASKYGTAGSPAQGPGTGGSEPIRGGHLGGWPMRGEGTPGPGSLWSHPTTAEHN